MIKKSGILFISGLLLSIPLFGKPENSTDSLIQLLNKEVFDTARFDLYIKIVDNILNDTPASAYVYIQEAKKIADKLNDTTRLVKSVNRFSDFYNQMGEYSMSLENAYYALELSKNNKKLQSLCHNRIATVHASLKNYEDALVHNRMSMMLDRAVNDTGSIMVDYHNMGSSFLDLKLYDSALFYLRRSDGESLRKTKMHDTYSASSIGMVYTETQQFDSALYYHFIAYNIDSMKRQEYLMAIDEQFIAITYNKMKNFEMAKKFAFLSIDRANKLKSYDLKPENFELLYTIFASENNYSEAFKYALLYEATKDTLRQKSKESLILGLETKYRFKEQETKLMANEAAVNLLERQKTLLMVLAILSTLFLISVFIFAIMIYRRHAKNKELMHELKLANDSKERMISIISHDLRSSVGALRNAAQLINEGALEGNDTRDLLESFFPVADSTYDLLENLLTWTQYSRGKLSPSFELVNLKDIVIKTLSHTTHLANSKSIHIIDHTEEVKLYADPNMILCVLRNFVSNAIKFSFPGSKVTLESKYENDFCIVSITDEGVGIRSEMLEKLFESPTDFHSSGTLGERGSGLGISLCKIFVQKHNGKVWAMSVPEKGSSFYFSLPAGI